MVRVEAIPIQKIRRPLFRQNDPAKVADLMKSIQENGLQEPIDILEVDGEYYGFSGCHRYEACTRLGHDMILCRIRRAPRSVLQRHLA
jgi:sulfiredoxin